MSEDVDILVIGHSHTLALRDYLKTNPIPGIQAMCLNIEEDGWIVDGVLQRGQFHPSVVDGIHPKHVFLMFGGNLHVSFGLIEHPIRFDFIAPGDEDESIDDGREYIPYSVVHEQLNRNMRKGFLRRSAEVRDYFKVPAYHICSPPAFSDSDYIVQNPGGAFKDLVKLGVAPPAHRRRLYELHSKIVRDWCAENDIKFIPPPEAAVDDERYLKREYWFNDVSHANEAYGGLVIEQILQTVGRA